MSMPRQPMSRRALLADFARGIVRHARATVAELTPTKWALIIACIVGAVLAWLYVPLPDIAALREWSHHLGPWFAVAFAGAYVIFTLPPIPRTLWTVAAGIFFGPWWGTLIALGALTASASIAFLAVRTIAGEWVAPHLQHPAVATMTQRLQQRGWLAVGSLRMIAGVPFSILNYVCGLSGIPLGQFALATLIGSIPTTVLGVLFGDALTGSPEPWLIAVMAVLAAVGVAGMVIDARAPLANVKPKG